MTRRRKDTGTAGAIYEVLLYVPAWVGPALAIGVYAGFRFLMPALLQMRGSKPDVAHTIGPMVAPWLGFLILVLWIFAEIQKWQRRRLFGRQQGLDDIRNLTWEEFEHFVGEAYRRHGYAVEETGANTADGGVDLILRGRGQTVLVQCKQWRTRSVGVRVVRELKGILAAEKADRAIVVCTGEFTAEAQKFANESGVELVGGEDLVALIESGRGGGKATPKQTSKPAATQATVTESVAAPEQMTCPKCGRPMVLRTAKRGANPGSKFWGCSAYPACRVTTEYQADGVS